jgi:O-antigen ligase
MIAIGLLESIYGLVQTLIPSMGVLWVDYIDSYLGTARGTFINRNNFAGHLEMIWPLALGVAFSMTGRVKTVKEALNSDKLNRQALMALGIIVLLMALIFTRSRGGIISGLAGLAAFSLLAKNELKIIARQSRYLVGGILVLLSAYMTTIGIGPIVQRFLSLRGGGISRMDIWKDSLPVVRDHPLGIGLGNYENVFALYNQSATSNETVVFAHSDYFQLLIETGWFGFACLTGAFLIYLWKSALGIKKIDARRDPLTFFLAVGAFSGLMSIAVHSFFDFNLQIPANCLYFVVLITLLNSCIQEGQRIIRNNR